MSDIISCKAARQSIDKRANMDPYVVGVIGNGYLLNAVVIPHFTLRSIMDNAYSIYKRESIQHVPNHLRTSTYW